MEFAVDSKMALEGDRRDDAQVALRQDALELELDQVEMDRDHLPVGADH
jgi:hypothetical protein